MSTTGRICDQRRCKCESTISECIFFFNLIYVSSEFLGGVVRCKGKRRISDVLDFECENKVSTRTSLMSLLKSKPILHNNIACQRNCHEISSVGRF